MSQTLAKNGNKMATGPASAPKGTTGGKEDSHITQERLSWFQQKFPHFFTPKVIQNRGIPLQLTTAREVKEFYIKRKVAGKSSTVDSLRVEQFGEHLKLFCETTAVEWQVAVKQFCDAAHMPVQWVGIRVGNETLTLNRDEIRKLGRELGLFTSPLLP